MIDLGPAARQMAGLVVGVDRHRLGGPTPCQEWTVADLLAHVHQLTVVFTANAAKEATEPPEVLGPDWDTAIPGALDDLVQAWQAESAWTGRVSAGGVEMAAADNALVALEELTVHGWDLARATRRPFDVDDDRLDLLDRFTAVFGDEPFGPAVAVPAGATRLDRFLARTGRDPSWAPTA